MKFKQHFSHLTYRTADWFRARTMTVNKAQAKVKQMITAKLKSSNDHTH